MTEITIKQIYDEIIKNRSEIKSSIEASEARLLLKIEEDKRRINDLEKENDKLKEEIESLQRFNKKNNIIIFGINHQNEEITFKFIQQKLKDLLEVNLEVTDINNFYTLGNLEDSPIKIELTTYLKKKWILQNLYKLKSTNIFINHDLTITQREKNKQLRKYLHLYKQDETKTCYLKKGKLFINDKGYTLEELIEIEDQEENNDKKTNSAPATPSNTLSQHGVLPPISSQNQANILRKPETPKTGTIRKYTGKNQGKTYDTRNRLAK